LAAAGRRAREERRLVSAWLISIDIVCRPISIQLEGYMRRALKIALVLLLPYPLLFVGFYIAMCQSPEVFSGIMSKTSNVAFLIFPFKRMWLSAREGSLKVGDAASDFSLETYDRKSRVRLSSFRGKKPVVLVFGSYT
jgi:hypothetical protein